jgi:hypothetical protein
MGELFQIAAKVSTPLALAGLVAAILFLIFRQILTLNIFPRLNQALGGKVIISIVNRLFILALVAMVLGFAGFVLVRKAPATTENSENVNLPNGLRLKDAAEYIAQSDSASVAFASNCGDAILSAEIRGGEFGAPSTSALIEHLRFQTRQSGAVPMLRVTLKERGLYEVSCQ